MIYANGGNPKINQSGVPEIHTSSTLSHSKSRTTQSYSSYIPTSRRSFSIIKPPRCAEESEFFSQIAGMQSFEFLPPPEPPEPPTPKLIDCCAGVATSNLKINVFHLSCTDGLELMGRFPANPSFDTLLSLFPYGKCVSESFFQNSGIPHDPNTEYCCDNIITDCDTSDCEVPNIPSQDIPNFTFGSVPGVTPINIPQQRLPGCTRGRCWVYWDAVLECHGGKTIVPAEGSTRQKTFSISITITACYKEPIPGSCDSGNGLDCRCVCVKKRIPFIFSALIVNPSAGPPTCAVAPINVPNTFTGPQGEIIHQNQRNFPNPDGSAGCMDAIVVQIINEDWTA